MKKNLILISIFILSFMSVSSQDKPLYYIGGYADFNYNIHWANFSEIGDIPNCCPEFKSGTGMGFAFGGLFEYPLKDVIFLGTRLGISTLNGLLEEDELDGNVLIPTTNGLVYATSRHTIDSKIFTAGIEPYLNYKFFGLLSSYIGINISYMATGTADFKETLIDPTNKTFPNGRVIQNDFYDKEIPTRSSMLFFGVFGLGYDLPVSRTIILTPEIRYNLPLNNIADADWKISTWQFGASLKIPIYPPKQLPVRYDTLIVRDTSVIALLNLDYESVSLKNREIETEEIETDDEIIFKTLIKEKYEKQIAKLSYLNASITTVGIKSDGLKQANPSIIIEEVEVEEGFPLLPFVFFEEGKAELDKTGMHIISKDETKVFSENLLSWKTLDIYSDMLNIIGHRLMLDPKKELTIVGCNKDDGIEKNNSQLSKDRANALRDYFVNVWGINQANIKTKWQNLPDNPGTITDPDGMKENQRAELKITDIDLIKPVILKEVERTADPPVIMIYPKVESESEINNYKISINQSGNNLRNFEGSVLPAEVQWNLEEEPIPSTEAFVDISLNAKDKLGQTVDASTSLKLQQLTIKKKRYELKDDKKVERFFLIVFDFNSAEIKPYHKSILNDIKSRIQPDSKVTISGYTDRTGDPEYNMDLAKRRCLEAQKVLKVEPENLTINPVGSQTLLYDNNLPQGRSYCRTVQIEVETPVK